MKTEREYPVWVCRPCGQRWGRHGCGVATWHTDVCGLCGAKTSVTEPRDYGHLRDGWESPAENNLDGSAILP
jgi:rRNA maturation protein Nop10